MGVNLPGGLASLEDGSPPLPSLCAVFPVSPGCLVWQGLAVVESQAELQAVYAHRLARLAGTSCPRACELCRARVGHGCGGSPVCAGARLTVPRVPGPDL